MRTCPQCNSQFGDDYFFCLNDGTTLIDSSGEVETRVQMRVPASGGPSAPCPSCGTLNRLNSAFCKQCGATLAAASQPEPTQYFQAPVFTPPRSSQAPAQGRTSGQTFLLAAIFGSILVIGGIVIYMLNSGAPAANNSNVSRTSAGGTPNRPATTNTITNTVATATNANAPVANNPASTSCAGRLGTLTTDVHLRSYAGARSDDYASDRGVQYRGARVCVLESQDADTEKGRFTFHHIQVLSYGVSADANNAGLPKDPGASDDGWIHGYPLLYDRARPYRGASVRFD